MPVYPGKRRGQWRVVVWAHGRQHERSVTGLKSDAEIYESRLRADLDAGPVSAKRKPMTFAEFCKGPYRAHAETQLRGSTWRKVRSYQIATLARHIGNLRLTEITARDVEQFKQARLREGIKPSSINNELRVLRRVLNFAHEQGYPVARIEFKRLKQSKARVHWWKPEQVEALYAACKDEDPALLPLFVFLLNTGVRKGEAIAAEWSWLDRDALLLRIPVTDSWQPKDDEAREVPITEGLLEVIGEEGESPYLFPARHGGRFLEFPEDRYRAVVKAAGLKGGPHTTRHTFASVFLSTVPDLPLLARLLGHSHERTTALYAHMLPGHLARARGAVNLMPQASSSGQTLGNGDTPKRDN